MYDLEIYADIRAELEELQQEENLNYINGLADIVMQKEVYYEL